ncbi:MAG: MurT ligase domain-containing protein [Ruminococcus sp.]|nr:MurT ligase domain-containing protein [Ruminococcus sp.]
MRVIFTILVCKLLRFAGKLLGKGSSLPGQVALKLCPDILSRISLPDYIIAVTGSNGKTSTVEMIAHILTGSGKKVAWNKEGSNQIEGVTTLVLDSATLSGKVKADILLIESDERFARYTFKYIKPTHYVITNLYRDQLTRNGHPEWVYNAIEDSIHDGTQLILNADDPLVSRFGWGKKNVVWFGADKLSTDTETLESVYNDGAYCPVCKAKMEYSTHHYNHIGHYRCTKCGYRRMDTQYTITSVDLDKGVMEIDGKYKISLALKSLYNIYNILSAYTVASIVGIDGEKIAADMNNYVLKNGRVITFKLGSREGTMLTSKHENSISYDQSLRVASAYKQGCDVMIIVDAVSRKYFTSDVSWLWDIDFEMLGSPNIHQIVLAGKYVNDLAVRFSYTDIPQEKIKLFESIDKAVDHLDSGRKEYIYVITCFSDKGKFLGKVNGD